MRIVRGLGLSLLAVIVLVSAAVTVALTVRPGLDAVAAHRRAAPPPAGAIGLDARWFGTTAVLLSDGDHAVMVDPFFTRPPGLLNLVLNREIAPDEALIRRELEQAGIRHLDVVAVSHSHYDHAMDAGVVARLTGATLVGSASTANIGRGAGLPEARIRVIDAGEALHYGPFTLTFIESRHAGATGGAPVGEIAQPLVPPARYLDYKLGGAYSILIEHPLGSVLHHGSAGFVPGALKGRKADVVFLGIALLPDLAGYLQAVVDEVGARRIVPTHWDDFTRPLDQPPLPFPVGVHLHRFFSDVARLRPQLQVQTLLPGESMVLFSGAGDKPAGRLGDPQTRR